MVTFIKIISNLSGEQVLALHVQVRIEGTSKHEYMQLCTRVL